MKTKTVKIVTTVPKKQADKLRQALGKAGAGKTKNYYFCSFSQEGEGRFLPTENANPSIGKKGKLNKIKEVRVETFCNQKDLKKIIKAIKKVHPYEQPIIDIYPLLYNPERLVREINK
jgi:hypothetical protein